MHFAPDENFDGRIIQGLQARLPTLDIIRVQYTAMYQLPDPELLAQLAPQGRILLTHDIRMMLSFVYKRVRAGQPMPGIIEVHRSTPIGQAIDELEILLGAGQSDDFENQIK
jgi:hypothetical protein